MEALPKKPAAEMIGNQLLRSATSVGANYRAACQGKSTADIIAKLSIVKKEMNVFIEWSLLSKLG